MTTYVVGDIHGCYDALARGLDKIKFSPTQDTLWCVGDLVNRGGQSCQTLELLYSMRDRITMVLGNHDIYLLAQRYGSVHKKINADLQAVLDHPDIDLWCQWLRQQPLCYVDAKKETVLVHAGIPHIWSLQQAQDYAAQASHAISTTQDPLFWAELMGNKPRQLKPKHCGITKQKVIINYLTRMRFITAKGTINLKRTERPSNTRTAHTKKGSTELPWYAYPRSTDRQAHIFFGHWASIKGVLHGGSCINATAMDTGCVWGGKLSFYNMETGHTITTKHKPCKNNPHHSLPLPTLR